MAIISKKSRYALHGLAYIAKFSNGEPVPFDEVLEYLKDYSQGLTLSSGYIAKVFQSISRAGITEAVVGPAGGYRLARDPEAIRIREIIETLDGPLLTDCCLLSVGHCRQQPSCGVKRVIHECEMIFYEFLEQNTVASLVRRMTFPDPAVSRAHDRGVAARTRKQPVQIRE